MLVIVNASFFSKKKNVSYACIQVGPFFLVGTERRYRVYVLCDLVFCSPLTLLESDRQIIDTVNNNNNRSITEDTRFSMENPSKILEKKPRAPTNKYLHYIG